MVSSSSKKKATEEKKKPAISYFSKDKVICPVCKKAFEKEVMRSGNGRMIAGGLTDDLHRIFEPSAKFGRIYPLIYDIGACPNCYTALLWSDFTEIKKKEDADKLFESRDERKEKVNTIFPHFNLKHERSLFDGCAYYYLALLTYSKLNPDLLPTMKSAFLSLRLSFSEPALFMTFLRQISKVCFCIKVSADKEEKPVPKSSRDTRIPCPRRIFSFSITLSKSSLAPSK